MLDFFKHVFQFFFCQDAFIKAALKRAPNPSKDLPEQFRKSTEQLRRHIFRAFRFVLYAIIAALIVYGLTLIFKFHIPHWGLILLRIIGYCAILWSIMSYLGYPIRTFDGETLPEIFDEEWHKFLYGTGLFLLLFTYLSELPPSEIHFVSVGNIEFSFPLWVHYLFEWANINFPTALGRINWQIVTGISAGLIAYFAYALNRDTNKPEIGLFYDNDKKQLTLKNYGNLPARDVFLIYRHLEFAETVKASGLGRSGGDLVFGKEEISMSPMVVADLTKHAQFLICVWRYRFKKKTILRERVFVRLPDFPNWATTIEPFVSKREWKVVKERSQEIRDKFENISKISND